MLSPNARSSRWLKLELIYALQHARYDGRIVPLILRRCDPARVSWTLGAFQHVDFRQGFAAGLADLLHLWQLV